MDKINPGDLVVCLRNGKESFHVGGIYRVLEVVGDHNWHPHHRRIGVESDDTGIRNSWGYTNFALAPEECRGLARLLYG